MITVLRSPACNILHFNDLLLRLQKAGEGVRGGSKLANTPALAYADDIVLIDRKVAGLQSKLDIVRLWSEDWGMTVNLKKGKTEHMVFGGERKRNFTLRFGAAVVRRTKSYKYLGVMLDSEDTKLSMLAQRQKTLRSAFGLHNAVAQLQVASPDMPLGTIGSTLAHSCAEAVGCPALCVCWCGVCPLMLIVAADRPPITHRGCSVSARFWWRWDW